MKKFLSMLLTTALVLSSATTAFAAEVNDEVTDVEITEEAAFEDAACEAEAFSYQEAIGDYNVSLDAAEGVFPNGTSVVISKASDEREAQIAEMVKPSLSEDEELVKTITFDFDFADADGNKVEPENGAVDVKIDAASDIETIEGEADNEVVVFHITDSDVLEEVSAVNENGVVSFPASEFSSYTVVVTNHHIADTEAPKVKSAVLSKSVVNLTDDYDSGKIELTANLTDDISGVSYGYFTFTNTKTKDEIDFYLDDEDYVDGAYVPYEDGLWHATQYVSSEAEGTYNLTDVTIHDAANNYLYYTTNNSLLKSSTTYKKMPAKLKKLSFTIKRAKIDFTPSITDVTISPTAMTLVDDNMNKVSVTVTATSTGDEIDNIKVTLKKDDGSDFAIRYMYRSYQNPGVFEGSTSLSKSTYYYGTWHIDSVEFTSIKGGYAIFSKDNKKLPKSIYSKSITINGGAIDTTIPTIKSIKFGKKKLTITDKDVEIPVEAVVADKGNNVEEVYVYLKNTNSNKGYYTYLRTKKGNKMTGTLTINRYAASGTFKIANCDVTDTAGNGTCYLTKLDKSYKSSKTYKYKTLTSAIKKVKLTIKNDFSYTIKFNANGGKGKMNAIKNVKANKKVKLTANKFKAPKGKKFAGWNTAKDGSGVAYKNKASVKNIAEKKGTVTLYAQWK